MEVEVVAAVVQAEKIFKVFLKLGSVGVGTRGRALNS